MIKKLPGWLENRVDPIELLFRIIVGGIFIYAGILKINDLQSFELSIRNYQILNDPWVALIAITLPPLEIILGTAILIRFLYHGALFIASLTLIIFIASLLTFQGGITVPGYAASKGGIGQLVMALSNEWASEGIQVNAIAPGYIATDNTQALRDDADRSKAILQRIPSGRWGKPEDFVGPAIFLSSAASDYMNGSILTVDGGWMGR